MKAIESSIREEKNHVKSPVLRVCLGEEEVAVRFSSVESDDVKGKIRGIPFKRTLKIEYRPKVTRLSRILHGM